MKQYKISVILPNLLHKDQMVCCHKNANCVLKCGSPTTGKLPPFGAPY